MKPDLLKLLERQTVTNIETAAKACGIGRTLAYQLARERGELCEGVRVLRVGRKLCVPVRPLLVALGYEEGRCRDDRP